MSALREASVRASAAPPPTAAPQGNFAAVGVPCVLVPACYPIGLHGAPRMPSSPGRSMIYCGQLWLSEQQTSVTDKRHVRSHRLFPFLSPSAHAAITAELAQQLHERLAEIQAMKSLVAKQTEDFVTRAEVRALLCFLHLGLLQGYVAPPHAVLTVLWVRAHTHAHIDKHTRRLVFPLCEVPIDVSQPRAVPWLTAHTHVHTLTHTLTPPHTPIRTRTCTRTRAHTQAVQGSAEARECAQSVRESTMTLLARVQECVQLLQVHLPPEAPHQRQSALKATAVTADASEDIFHDAAEEIMTVVSAHGRVLVRQARCFLRLRRPHLT